MSNEIKDILQKLQLIEGEITPVGVKGNLNRQQKSVDQLPAEFHPKDIDVLGAKTDPQHPAKNYFVGAESKELEEASVDEDVLSRVKKGLNDYLKKVESEIKGDSDLKDRKADDRDLQKPNKSKDRDLLPKITGTISDTPTSSPVKTFHFEDGRICEIHGDESQGFSIKHMDRVLPSRFNKLNDAEIAMQMYQARCRDRAQEAISNMTNPDYVDEA